MASEEKISKEAAGEKVAGEEVASEEAPDEETASEEVTSEEDEEEGEDFFGASLDLGYVGPDVWAGFQVSEGARIQPIIKFSVWKFAIGIFWNIYGSEKDRKVNTQPPPDYLYGYAHSCCC